MGNGNHNMPAVRRALARYGATLIETIDKGKHTTLVLRAADGHIVHLQVSLGKVDSFKQEGWVRQALTRPARPVGTCNRNNRR